jgi:SAM-dependent methyltransferase
MSPPHSQDDEIQARPQPECFVCDTRGQQQYRDLRDRINHAPGLWNISRCPNPACGLLWLDPMPLEADIGKAYTTYFTHGSEQPVPGEELRQYVDSFGESDLLRRALPVHRLRRALRSGYLAAAYGYTDGVPAGARLSARFLYLQPLWVRDLARSIAYLKCVRGGRLLDVGCGDGRFITDMQALGWNAEGIEVDPQAVAEARRRGLRVQCGSLTHLHFDDACFDAVVLNHVLEHVHDPGKLLRECCRILRPGGQFRVFVPNAGGLGHRQFGRNWGGLDPPRHLYHFTPQALRVLIARAGFRARVWVSSAADRYLYRASFALASENDRRDSLLRTARLYALDVRDSIGTLLSRDWGEEIAVTDDVP